MTLKDIKKLQNETDNQLKKEVCDYIIDVWDDYDDKNNIFEDVLNHGCRSGIVGSLCYYSDTTAFYEKYKEEISQLLYDDINNTGLTIDQLLTDFDSRDPLALNMDNQNLLAWYGFEQTLYNIYNIFGED